jgi:hypothetical protein
MKVFRNYFDFYISFDVNRFYWRYNKLKNCVYARINYAEYLS